MDKLFFENIDEFHNDKHRRLYKKCPSVIKFYLHEVGHLMTMDLYDLNRYHMEDRSLYFKEKDKIKDNKDRQRLYHEISYEKLADNLSSEFYYNNYDIIMKILQNKRTRITSKRVKDNMDVAKKMRDKYVKAV